MWLFLDMTATKRAYYGTQMLQNSTPAYLAADLRCACEWCQTGNVVGMVEMANYEMWVAEFTSTVRPWWRFW
jgi:hypothetical protein